MAIIWADFPSGQRGIYDSDGSLMLNGIWAETSSAGFFLDVLENDVDPVIGAAGIVARTDCVNSSSGDTGDEMRFVLPAEVTTLGIGFRMWLAKLPTVDGDCPFMAFRNNANNSLILIRISTTGQLIAYSGGGAYGSTGGAVEVGRSIPCITANAYQHVEIKATKGAGTGAVEIRVNGAAKLTLAALAFSANNIAQFALGNHNNAGGNDGAMITYWKDLVVWDTAGAYGNDFQGSVAVYDLVPNADIALNWTPSSGATGWDLIDENAPNDADYISAPFPAPAAAVFGLTNLPTDVTSVRALLPIMRAEKTDGGDCNIQAGLTPNNVNWVNGADRPMTTAFTYWWSPIHTSPVTAVPWTPAEVNAAYVRVNRTL